MFYYRQRDNFMFTFHTGSMLFYLASIVVLSSILSNPIYLITLLFTVIAITLSCRCLAEMKTYFAIAIPMVVLIMIINPLLSREGQTIIFTGPVLPVLGRLEVSLEAVLYGGNMGIRLMIIIAAFGLFNLLVDPDKFLSFLSRFIKNSAMTIGLSARMVPNMAKRLGEIKDIYRTRGVNLSEGNIVRRIKLMIPLMKVLLLSALEDTFKVAESMQARGFGGARRSHYTREKVKPRDFILYAATVAAWVLAIVALTSGWGAYSFYPHLTGLGWNGGALFVYAILTAVIMTPAILALGCEKWQFMKFKI